MPRIPSLAAFLDPANGYAPKPAEERLIAACRAGRDCMLGPLPDILAPDRIIRAELLRLLIIGGTAECGLDQIGVWLEGAWIEGTLDLRHATARGQTVLHACTFVAQPQMTQANLQILRLAGSDLWQGLFAQGMIVAGDVFLSNLSVTGTVDMSGATVGGQLDCDGAKLIGPMVDGTRGMALDAQSVQVTASLFLRNLTTTGTVDVAGSTVGGQLDCTGATLDGAGGKALDAQSVQVTGSLFLRDLIATGTVNLVGADIGGAIELRDAQLDGRGREALYAQSARVGQGLFLRRVNTSGTVNVVGASISGQIDSRGARFDGKGHAAFHAQRLTLTGSLFWQGVAEVKGRVVLSSARVGDLVDDAASWPKADGDFDLDGFTYDNLIGSTVASFRIDWLRRGSVYGGSLNPQPYVQLAKVLRGMGHEAEARRVMVALGTRLRVAAVEASLSRTAGVWAGFRWAWGLLLLPLRVLWHVLEWAVAGYGHRPFGAILSIAALWLGAGLLADATWREGSFAPNSAVVLTSPGWTGLLAIDCIGDMPDPLPPGVTACDRNPADTWSARAAAGMDWDSFSPAGYGIDLVVPILNLGQTDAWAPSRDRGPMGWWLWWGRWVLIGAGWLVSALGVAAITGIMQRNQPGVT